MCINVSFTVSVQLLKTVSLGSVLRLIVVGALGFLLATHISTLFRIKHSLGYESISRILCTGEKTYI